MISQHLYNTIYKWKEFILLLPISILVQVYFYFASDQWTLDDGMIIATMVRNFKEYSLLTHHHSDILGTATSPIFALLAGIISKIGISPILSLKLVGMISLIIIGFYGRKQLMLMDSQH